VTIDDCSRFAIHDLAALAEGHLSQDGLHRLARHLRSCHRCRATLALIVQDTELDHGSSAPRRLAAWLDSGAADDDVQASAILTRTRAPDEAAKS
jgi:anti-sigma factor RsiW